jgi:hypothetical protein
LASKGATLGRVLRDSPTIGVQVPALS